MPRQTRPWTKEQQAWWLYWQNSKEGKNFSIIKSDVLRSFEKLTLRDRAQFPITSANLCEAKVISSTSLLLIISNVEALPLLQM